MNYNVLSKKKRKREIEMYKKNGNKVEMVFFYEL